MDQSPLLSESGTAKASAAKAEEEPATVSKVALIDAVKRRSQRTRACYSLPMSLLMYVLFCISYIWHTDTTTTYTYEVGILNDFVYGSCTDNSYAFSDIVYDRASWVYWLQTELLPCLVVGDGSDPSAATMLINGYAQALGGIRLLQLRTRTVTCPDPVSRKLYPGACFEPVDPASIDPQADPAQRRGASLTGSIGNATVGAAYGVPVSAYSPTTLPGDSLSGYQLLLSSLGPAGSSDGLVNGPVYQVQGLADSEWLDGSTSLLRVQAALLNAQPSVDRWAVLTYDIVLTRGGIPRTAATVTSFPHYAYGRGFEGASSVAVVIIDVILIFYAVYLLVGTMRRAVSAAAKAKSVGAKLSAVLADPWRLIDYAASFSLVACIICWSIFVDRLTRMRNDVSNDSAASPAVYSDGVSRPGFLAAVLGCEDAYSACKLVAAWTLIFLAVRQFKYLQYQPRLAVFSQALSMSINDGAAFGVLFIIILSVYGVWGMAMFGNQAPDWSDGHVTITSLFRFMMYDYDLPTMESTGYVDMARLYFASYMLIVTNMTLWMFLAIFLDAYTVVRNAAHVGSGITEDGVEAVTAIFERIMTCPPWRRGGCCSRTRNGVASCDALLDVLESKEGSVARMSRLTLGALHAAARVAAGTGGTDSSYSSVQRHALTSMQVKSVFEEGATIEGYQTGVDGTPLPALTGLSSDEDTVGGRTPAAAAAASPSGMAGRADMFNTDPAPMEHSSVGLSLRSLTAPSLSSPSTGTGTGAGTGLTGAAFGTPSKYGGGYGSTG